MKRGADQHPKFRRLCRRLRLEPWACVGLLESVWHFTAKVARDGAIGRWSDEDIADGIGWKKRSATELVEALVVEGWVDRDERHRLVVHGWSEHADDAIHKSIARARGFFADGSAPKLYVLSQKQREEAEKWYAGGNGNVPGSNPEPSGQEPEVSRSLPEPVSQSQSQSQSQKILMGDAPSPDSPAPGNLTEDRLAKEFRCVVRPYYPRRDGDQRWKKALGHFRAARKRGEPLEVIVAGVRRYAEHCERKGIVGTDKVKQAATFFAPEDPPAWRDPSWAPGNGPASAGGFLA